MATVITLDLGPTFIGQTIQTGGEMICVLSPAAFTDARVQARIRKLTGSQGTDCRRCRGCVVGTAK